MPEMECTLLLITSALLLSGYGTSARDCYPEPGALEDLCRARCCLWQPDSTPGAPWCTVREDCHAEPGATQHICEARGCTWEPASCSGVPWCYIDQNNNPSGRVDCHPEPGASKEGCQARGCIWMSSSIQGDPWCYQPGTGPDPPQSELRIDCFPDSIHRNDVNPQNCHLRGCIWKETSEQGAPWCYFPSDDESMAGYDVASVDNTEKGISGSLVRRSSPSLFGDDRQNLRFCIDFLSSTHVRFSVYDAEQNHKPVFLPNMEEYLSKKAQTLGCISRSKRSVTESIKYNVTGSDYNILLQERPFGVAIERKSNGAIIFDTRSLPGFTFSKQYLQISSRLASGSIYGLGENQHLGFQRNLNWQKWVLFTRDQFPRVGPMNLYGSHPFYLGMEQNGNAHGVLLLNAHPMNIALQPNPNIITYRPIGGILDFHIFMGPEPNSVIQQYTSAIGLPMMPPYWALGFQISRYGYKTTEDVRQVLKRNKEIGIPQDVQVIDIEYMDAYKDFTYDKIKYKNLPELVSEIHADNKRLILIIDPMIAAHVDPDSYQALKVGLEMNIFIKNPKNDTPFMGHCWPGSSYYPDFTHPNISNYWEKMHRDFHAIIPFDGLWDDMNEPAYFEEGKAWLGQCAENSLNFPPFNPSIVPGLITAKTLCMDARHHNGTHYEWHNRFGFGESVASSKSLRKLFPGKRPMLLSRSTFIGSGAYTAHWTGDVSSEWDQLYISVVQMLEFNLFGIPFVGADICGFAGTPSSELCVRWHQIGAFYPFSRNHNDVHSPDQDPAVWDTTAKNIIRKSVENRYKFLPYLYTLFAEANRIGSTVVRPLFFEFSGDIAAYSIDRQFLWGSALMVVPALEEGARQVLAYFPKGRWFWVTKDPGREIAGASGGRRQIIDVPLSEIGVFIRGGSVIPWQESAMTTHESRQKPMGLLVALNETGGAQGSLFWDDGESANTYQADKYFQMTFTVDQGTLKLIRVANGSPKSVKNLKIATIQVNGMQIRPSSVKINGQTTSAEIDFNEDVKTMTLTNLNLQLGTGAEIQNVQWQ